MQRSNLTKCGLFFNIVCPAVHTPLPSVLQSLDSRGIESLILILNCRYDLIIGPLLLLQQSWFFHVGEQKIIRWYQIRRIWRMINQFKSQSCTATIATTELCAGALFWWNRTSSVFQAFWNVSSIGFPAHFRHLSIQFHQFSIQFRPEKLTAFKSKVQFRQIVIQIRVLPINFKNSAFKFVNRHWNSSVSLGK